MRHKITGEILVDSPPGLFWGLTKILGKIICWALKRRSFYNIVSACLEKEGKQIMNIEKLDEKIETITKNSTELKKGNRSFEAKLNAITKNSTELKESNRELKEGNQGLEKSNQRLEERLEAIAKNSKEDKRELKEDNRELKEDNRELKKMLRQLLENQNKKN